MKKLFLFFLVIVLVISACVVEKQEEQEEQENIVDAVIEMDKEYPYYESDEPWLIDPDEVRSGGPPQDGIPSIDSPLYVTVEEADEWIEDNELVLALLYEDVVRVYPLQILVWHEIVNDEINEDPILITYCPLCGSGIAYHRIFNDEAVEFGTSGQLYNSNLIMYDRLTESYWTQIDGLAITGEMISTELEEISIDTVTWGNWKKAYPQSEVLSQDTGYLRAYGTDPYGSYYVEDLLFFPVSDEDESIHPKTVTYGIEIDGIYKAYLETDVILAGNYIEDEVNGVSLILERSDEGIVIITRLDNGEEVVKERDFWFAWYAFHPDTLVYGR
jgi:hypothetical protein